MLHRSKSKETHHDSFIPRPSFLRSESGGQKPVTSNAPSRPSPLSFFSSSAKPTTLDPQKVWEAEYLTKLRTNRPARPSGSRPLPNRSVAPSPAPTAGQPVRPLSALSRPFLSTAQSDTAVVPGRCSSAMSHRKPHSILPSASTRLGRPLVQEPQLASTKRDFSASTTTSTGSSTTITSGTYIERGSRWLERQEARSLREALEDKDIQDQQRLHKAAQKEASELVSEHRNPQAPVNPYKPYKHYKQHLDKDSHARSQSHDLFGEFNRSDSVTSPSQRSVSDTSSSAKNEGDRSQERQVFVRLLVDDDKADQKAATSESHVLGNALEKNVYRNFTNPLKPSSLFSRRRASGSKLRKASGEKGLFSNPDDRIYEEPEEVMNTSQSPVEAHEQQLVPLKSKTRNSLPKVKFAKDQSTPSTTTPTELNHKPSRFEIHRNPPSQSRNPDYVRNALPPTPTDSTSTTDSDSNANRSGSRNDVEIRGDDIRAATSMRLKDRSPKLPTPTAVSDRPGRPIVSFDPDWKPSESQAKRNRSPSSFVASHSKPERPLPVILPPSNSTASDLLIPTINFPESPQVEIQGVPEISVSSAPSISISGVDDPTPSRTEKAASARPLPRPFTKPSVQPNHRPLPHHSSTAPNSTSHWSPSTQHRATAQCYACALPISGRIVSAASQRFHPHCFSCFNCGELLECVAFYPEPDTFRSTRITRIHARANDEPVPSDAEGTSSPEDDGDESLRFYCHLDFHEKFSPRCRSCKTPIEGEVVLACGGEWHKGHFFCAECGDPFDEGIPFVEREGYAWCVGCHTRRFSGKCQGCRRPVCDGGVRALGGEWHEECFCCEVCSPLGVLNAEVGG